MKIGILAFSAKGFSLGETISGFLSGQTQVSRCEKGRLGAWTEEHFRSDDLIIYVGSCGIAVRAIAPFVAHKTEDPAVLVVDETGKFAVSLLSGHIGGANAWCSFIAEKIGAIPVITTATDRSGVFAVDTWAKKIGLSILNPEKIVEVSSKLLDGKTVGFASDFPVEGKLPENVIPGGQDFSVTVRDGEGLLLVPPVITLGVGCRRDTPVEKIEEAFQNLLSQTGIHVEAVKQVCSIDLKANEPGLMEFCKNHSFPFHTYTAEELQQVEGEFTASKFVSSVVGVDNVCERSAVKGSGGQLIVKKQAGNGVTMAMAQENYTVTF